MIILILILSSFLQWNLHIQYIFNPNIYRTKWFNTLYPVFPNNSGRICPIKLKIGMLYQINNTSQTYKPCFIYRSKSLINFYSPLKPSDFERIEVNSFAQFHLSNDRKEIWWRSIDIRWNICTAQKMKFFMKDFLSKCHQIRKSAVNYDIGDIYWRNP